MSDIILSLGYDTERPHGAFAESPSTRMAARQTRSAQLSYISRLNAQLDKMRVPRTFFMLGHFLERCLDDYTQDQLLDIFAPTNPLVDIQQHSHSHPIIRPPSKGETGEPVTAEEFGRDVGKANRVAEDILRVRPEGLRTPRGYDTDLSDRPDVLKVLRDEGIRFVSSDLRGVDSIDAPLTRARQPRTYEHAGVGDIVEVPSHGWQDVIFTKEKAQQLLGTQPAGPEYIVGHYTGLLDSAAKLADSGVSPVCISLCLHPWAALEYDPALNIHTQLVDGAKDRGISIASYKSVASRVRSAHVAELRSMEGAIGGLL